MTKKTLSTDIKGVTKSLMNQRDDAGTPDSGDFMDRLRAMRKDAAAAKEGAAAVTEEMVYAQAMIFLAAGYETTATTLSLVTYMLAKHPEVQERCYQEVTQAVENIDNISDYSELKSLEFVEACIKASDPFFCGCVGMSSAI